MSIHPLPKDKCPRCQGTDLRSGEIICQGDGRVAFRPENIKFWSLSISGGVEFENVAHACLDCGFIWTEADPKELADFVATKCKPADKSTS